MKIDLCSPRSLLVAAAGTLLLLTAAACNDSSPRAVEPPSTEIAVPRSTFIVDTSAAGQANYEGLPGETPTLIISLPPLDSQYPRDPADHNKYVPIEDSSIADAGSQQVHAPGPHNIVLLNLASPPPGTVETARVKPPLVIIRTSKTDPSYMNKLKSGPQPVVVVDLPDNYPRPGPNGTPVSHTFTTPTPAP